MSAGAFLILLGACSTRDPSAGLKYPRVTLAIMARVDLDHDGRITQAEWTQLAFPDETMDRWDADKDGALDPREVEDAFRHADPARIQSEGRRVVYEKYGNPFGEAEEEAEEAPAAQVEAAKPARGDGEKERKKKAKMKGGARERRQR
jgi:hypothetical protein